MSFDAYSESRVRIINEYLDAHLNRFQKSTSLRFAPLIEAMRYSLEGGGKRLRPLLVIASAEALGLKAEDVLPAALAVEYIHTYSLIHDDLPALDDDDNRRGKPSSHKKFGEAVAILTGDALLTEAFSLVTQLGDRFGSNHVVSALDLLSANAGVRGLVGGQLIDVTIDTNAYTLPEVEFIHIHKTGAMILTSVLMPTKLTACDEAKIQKFKRYGEAVGLAFQISDDLLDAESSVRYSRGPRKKPKPSYLHLMAPAEMKGKLQTLIDSAIDAVKPLGEKAQGLQLIAEFIRTRKH